MLAEWLYSVQNWMRWRGLAIGRSNPGKRSRRLSDWGRG